MVMVRDARTLWVFGGACLLLLGAFRICGVVKLRENLQKLASNRRHVIQTRLEHRAFEAALSRIQEAENFGSWWRALSLAAQELGVSWMQLTWEDRSGRPRRLGWSVAQQVPSTAVSLHPDRSRNLCARRRRRTPDGPHGGRRGRGVARGYSAVRADRGRARAGARLRPARGCGVSRQGFGNDSGRGDAEAEGPPPDGLDAAARGIAGE